MVLFLAVPLAIAAVSGTAIAGLSFLSQKEKAKIAEAKAKAEIEKARAEARAREEEAKARKEQVQALATEQIEEAKARAQIIKSTSSTINPIDDLSALVSGALGDVTGTASLAATQASNITADVSRSGVKISETLRTPLIIGLVIVGALGAISLIRG